MSNTRTPTPPRIAMFSSGIYPSRGGTCQVAEQLARGFHREELMVVGGRHVLSATPPSHPGRMVDFHYLSSELNVFGRGARFFWHLRWALFPLLLSRAERLCKAWGANHVLAVYPEEFYILLGLKVAERLGIGFSTYFHNTYLENGSGRRLVQARRLQPLFFQKSRRVFMISDGLLRYYAETYPEVARKLRVLRHSFAKWPAPRPAGTAVRQPPRTAAFLGNFNHSNLEATCRAVAALAAGGWNIRFYTPVPKLLLQQRGIATQHLSSVEYVKEEQLMNRLQDADILVLTHGFQGAYADVEYRTIFPTRFLTLLLSGTPVLVHAPPGTFLADFVGQTGCASLVDTPDPAQLQSAAQSLYADNALRARLAINARKTCELFHVSRVRQALLDGLGDDS